MFLQRWGIFSEYSLNDECGQSLSSRSMTNLSDHSALLPLLSHALTLDIYRGWWRDIYILPPGCRFGGLGEIYVAYVPVDYIELWHHAYSSVRECQASLDNMWLSQEIHVRSQYARSTISLLPSPADAASFSGDVCSVTLTGVPVSLFTGAAVLQGQLLLRCAGQFYRSVRYGQLVVLPMLCVRPFCCDCQGGWPDIADARLNRLG